MITNASKQIKIRVAINNCNNLLKITKKMEVRELWLRQPLVTFGTLDTPISGCLCLVVKVAWVPFCTPPSFMHGACRLRAPLVLTNLGACGNSSQITSSISLGWIGIFKQNDACTSGRPRFCHSTVNRWRRFEDDIHPPSRNEKYLGAKQQLASRSECFEMIHRWDGASYMYLHKKSHDSSLCTSTFFVGAVLWGVN